MKFIFDYVKGIAIGAGAILPGISSGVLCVVFGIYEKLLNSVLSFFSDWKKNLRFLAPIVLGGLTGIVLFGNLLEYLFTLFPVQTKFGFIGLILGCLPVLFKTANNKKGFRLHYLFYLFLTFLFAIGLLYLENILSVHEDIYCLTTYSFGFLVFAGFLMSVGVVVPGVSSTVILMLLGIYDVYLSAVSMVNMRILIPMGIGLILGGFLFMKSIQKLMEKHRQETYYGIIGFVVGSIPILFPGFTMDSTGLISIICMVVCFGIGYFFEKN